MSVDCICTQLLANLAPTKMIKFVINSLTNVSQAVCTKNSYKNKGGIVSLHDLFRTARSQEMNDRQLRQFSSDQVDYQVNEVTAKIAGKERHASVVGKI